MRSLSAYDSWIFQFLKNVRYWGSYKMKRKWFRGIVVAFAFSAVSWRSRVCSFCWIFHIFHIFASTCRNAEMSSGTTESEVWIDNFNVKAWKTTKHILHKIWCSLKFCKIQQNEHTPAGGSHPWRSTDRTRDWWKHWIGEEIDCFVQVHNFIICSLVFP